MINMLKIDNISKEYKKKKVLNNINLLLENKTYGLLGPNGSGKTTLLRIIANIITPTTGHINKKELKIGYLPQKFGVLNELTVYEMMYYFASLKYIKKEDRDHIIDNVLKLVNLIEEKNKKCSQLSGGMLRRLGVAQAIMGEPDLILLDEPTVGLDLEERINFKTILQKLQYQYPILLSTHIVEDVEDVCDDIIVLNKGHILFNDSIEDFKRIADNRVYIVPKDKIRDLPENSINIEKYFIKDNIRYARVLNYGEKLDFDHDISTIEDSYMFLLKNE